MVKHPKDPTEMTPEKLLEYAIDILNISTNTKRRNARKHLSSFKVLYDMKMLMLDDALTYDQLEAVRTNLIGAADKILKLHPYVLVGLLSGKATFDELFFPNGKIWDTSIGPHPLHAVIETELLKPLFDLNERCERLIESLPKKARDTDPIRKQLLVSHILFMFAAYRPEKARPWTGEFPIFLQTVYWYVTGAKMKENLRRQRDAAFDLLRNEAPELLPKTLRTKRLRARPTRPRPKNT